jgi:hypothetical protein
MANAVVQVNGSGAAMPTVLGIGPARIPTGGKIRAGIKVLTKRAAENPRAKEIYEQGVAVGQSFEQIERLITEAVPEFKTPLVPKNVPWFTVRGEDFPNPQVAKDILDGYGEDRGDGVVRLYRFPVVFPSDTWQTIMPHELVAWGASGKRYWSEYSSDGRTRHCKCYAPVPKDDSGKRAIRVFGGRKAVQREDNGGICDPERCREYQFRECSLSGTFIFFIPGIKSLSAFELHTNSFYAMNAAIQRFETIAFMRGGRISGFLDDQRTPFYITKQLMEVPHIDEEGRPVRVKQWIISLEAPIDVAALLRAQDDVDAMTTDAQQAVRTIEGTRVAGDEESTPWASHPKGDGSDPPAQTSVADRTSARPVPEGGDAQAGCSAPAPAAASRASALSAPTLADVLAAVEEAGVPVERYERYAAKQWGAGWKLNVQGRRRALAEVESLRDCPAALVAKIDAELGLFA